MLPALHHDRDGVTRVIVRREAANQAMVSFFPFSIACAVPVLPATCTSSHTRDAARAAVFVHHFPKPRLTSLDLLRSEIVPEIGGELWASSETAIWPFAFKTGLAILH